MTAAADFKTACRDVAVTDDEAAAVDPLMRNLGNEFIMMIMIGIIMVLRRIVIMRSLIC